MQLYIKRCTIVCIKCYSIMTHDIKGKNFNKAETKYLFTEKLLWRVLTRVKYIVVNFDFELSWD